MSAIRYSNGTSWLKTQPRASSGSWANRQTYAGVSLVGSNGLTSYGAGSAGFNVAKVAGAASGDIAIVVTSNRYNATTTAPSGWTTVVSKSQNSSVIIQVFYRILDGTESWPYNFTSTISSGYGFILQQVVLRGSDGQVPTVSRSAGGYTTRCITSGILTPAAAGACSLLLVANNTGRTIEAPGQVLAQNATLASAQLTTTTHRLGNAQPYGCELRYLNGLADTFVSISLIVNPAV